LISSLPPPELQIVEKPKTRVSHQTIDSMKPINLKSADLIPEEARSAVSKDGNRRHLAWIGVLEQSQFDSDPRECARMLPDPSDRDLISPCD
jgi:hypothetical protein